MWINLSTLIPTKEGPLHYVLAHIPSKNPVYLFFCPKVEFWSYLNPGKKNFWKILRTEYFSSLLKKCTFAGFSTILKKTLKEFWIFHHSSQTGKRNHEISLSFVLSIHGAQLDEEISRFHPPVWKLWRKMSEKLIYSGHICVLLSMNC